MAVSYEYLSTAGWFKRIVPDLFERLFAPSHVTAIITEQKIIRTSLSTASLVISGSGDMSTRVLNLGINGFLRALERRLGGPVWTPWRNDKSLFLPLIESRSYNVQPSHYIELCSISTTSLSWGNSCCFFRNSGEPLKSFKTAVLQCYVPSTGMLLDTTTTPTTTTATQKVKWKVKLSS